MDSRDTGRANLSNRMLAERIICDLDELIDKRGRVHLVPQIIEMRKFLYEIDGLERLLAARIVRNDGSY